VTTRLINTTVGEIEESRLEKRTGMTDDGVWVEYYLDDVLVHRSATMGLWQGAASLYSDTGVCFKKYGVELTYTPSAHTRVPARTTIRNR
jgi:hypothetical protein